MTELTTEDKEFLRTKWNQTWSRCREDVDKSESTLQDYIKELAEIAENQIKAQILDIRINQISSFLNKEFLKEDRDIERSIQFALSPKYKQTGTNLESETLRDSNWITIETTDPAILLEQNQFNDFRINGVEKVDKKERVELIQAEPQKEIISPTLNDTTKSIYALEQTGSLIERTAHHFREYYDENKEILNKSFNGKLDFYMDQYAKHSNAKKAVDERGKWGDYEKIMAKFLMDTGETTARMAELLNYSSKYGSIGIDRHGEFVDRQTKRFKTRLLEFLMKCPLCKGNIYHKLNEQIERYHKDLELELTVAI